MGFACSFLVQSRVLLVLHVSRDPCFRSQTGCRGLGGPGGSGPSEEEAADRRRTARPPNRAGGVEGNVPPGGLDVTSWWHLHFIFLSPPPFPSPDVAGLPGPAQSGPRVANSPDWPAENPSLHLQLPEPSSSRSVPQRGHRDPQADRSVRPLPLTDIISFSFKDRLVVFVSVSLAVSCPGSGLREAASAPRAPAQLQQNPVCS